MRWEQLWKEISATILDLFSTRRIHTLSHSHKRKFISESHAGGLDSLCSSFIIGTVSIFVQVQTTCRWYSTPANYRADFKDWLIYSRTPPPTAISRQAPRRPRQPWCCALLFSFSRLIAHIFLLHRSFYSALWFCSFWDQIVKQSAQLWTKRQLCSVFHTVTW